MMGFVNNDGRNNDSVLDIFFSIIGRIVELRELGGIMLSYGGGDLFF